MGYPDTKSIAPRLTRWPSYYQPHSRPQQGLRELFTPYIKDSHDQGQRKLHCSSTTLSYETRIDWISCPSLNCWPCWFFGKGLTGWTITKLLSGYQTEDILIIPHWKIHGAQTWWGPVQSTPTSRRGPSGCSAWHIVLHSSVWTIRLS